MNKTRICVVDLKKLILRRNYLRKKQRWSVDEPLARQVEILTDGKSNLYYTRIEFIHMIFGVILIFRLCHQSLNESKNLVLLNSFKLVYTLMSLVSYS